MPGSVLRFRARHPLLPEPGRDSAGQEISRQYTVQSPNQTTSIQCQTPGADWNAADNLITITTLSTTPGFDGQPQSVLHPDGTMDIYSYQADDTYRTVTVMSGLPDATGTNIVDGTRTVTVSFLTGQICTNLVYSIVSGPNNILLSSDTYSYTDNLNLWYVVTHLDGTTESVVYGCCGLDSTTDRDFVTTTYAYDLLKRQISSTRNGITTSNILDAAGNVLVSMRIGSNGPPIITRQAAYDTAGRLASETNALGGGTVYSQSTDASGQTVKTITYPDNGTRIETYYQDGSLFKVTGTATFSVQYHYGVESDGGVQRAYTKETKLDASGNGTSEWTKTYADMLGRGYKTVYAAASQSPSATTAYNSIGQMTNQVSPDGVVTLYTYNSKGELAYSAIDVDRNYQIDLASADRVT